MYSSINYDLIVDDSGIKAEAKDILEKANCFEIELGNLEKSIKKILKHAMINGVASENLELFLDEVSGLKKEAKSIASDVKNVVHNYVDSIDDADGCVY